MARSSLTKAGGTRAWRRIRDAVLAEEPVCACGAQATEVDHIVARSRGGDDRRENLRGICKPCNLARNTGGAVIERAPW